MTLSTLIFADNRNCDVSKENRGNHGHQRDPAGRFAPGHNHSTRVVRLHSRQLWISLLSELVEGPLVGFFRAILFSLYFTGLFAQSPSTPSHRISGTVVDESTGNPIARALVQISSDQAVLTGADGRFSFDNLPAGEFRIMATKPGYLDPHEKREGWQYVRFAMEERQTTISSVETRAENDKVVLKLLPEAVVFGQATGDNEEPLENAAVEVFTFTSRQGHRILIYGGTGRTDEDGNFRIAGLGAGECYIRVKPPKLLGFLAEGKKPGSEQSYPGTIYYPDAANLSEAMSVNVKAGQRLELHFSLKTQPAFNVLGRVVANGGWKQLNPPLIVEPSGQPLFTPDKFDPTTGDFEFHAIPSGAYQVESNGTNLQGRPLRNLQNLVVTRNVNALQLLLRPGVDIPVAVRTEFTQLRTQDLCTSNGGKRESDCSDALLAYVRLQPEDDLHTGFSFRPGYGEESGSPVISGVLPGRYQAVGSVRVGGTYVQSLRSGGVDLFRENLVVPEDGSTAPVEAVLRDDGAALNVKVRAEKDVQETTVLIVPEGEVRRAQTRTLWGGREVAFSMLAPGNYQVFAFDSVEDFNYAEPGVLGKYSAKASRITLAPNGNGSITVDLIHAEE